MTRIPQTRPSGEDIRNILRLLGMLNQLHRQGWQRLRAHFAIAPSNLAWRCCIYPACIRKNEGPLPPSHDGPEQLIVRYTTAQRRKYFGWTDSEHDDARALAERFLHRFPEIATRGQGRDWAYVGWFNELLGQVERGRIPCMIWDGDDEAKKKMATSLWFWPELEEPFDFPPFFMAGR